MFGHEFLDSDESKEKDLAAEIDVLPWHDLVRHFAFGRLYVVRKPWTLIEAAHSLKADDAARLKEAMASSDFGMPSPEEAEAWHQANQPFEVVVISPFVLVQPCN